MRYLVQWNPYKVLKYLSEGEKIEVPAGCDILKELPDRIFEHIDIWKGDIDWRKVFELHEKKDYLEIFKMHNEGKWTDNFYCCEFCKRYVDFNVGLYKSS